MKHRVRATFSPPAAYMRAGTLPEMFERTCDGYIELADELRCLIQAGERLINLGARVVIEVVAIEGAQSNAAD